jgi:hypothetical protein
VNEKRGRKAVPTFLLGKKYLTKAVSATSASMMTATSNIRTYRLYGHFSAGALRRKGKATAAATEKKKAGRRRRRRRRETTTCRNKLIPTYRLRCIFSPSKDAFTLSSLLKNLSEFPLVSSCAKVVCKKVNGKTALFPLVSLTSNVHF